jgi:hypothetical protein
MFPVTPANPCGCLDNNVMHAKPDLRAVKSNEINCSGSVITAVIGLAELMHVTDRNHIGN